MKTYLDLPHELQALVDERHAKVNADPKVVAAFAARDAARAAFAIAFAARDAARAAFATAVNARDAARAAVIDARNAARAEAMARMFKKGKLK